MSLVGQRLAGGKAAVSVSHRPSVRPSQCSSAGGGASAGQCDAVAAVWSLRWLRPWWNASALTMKGKWLDAGHQHPTQVRVEARDAAAGNWQRNQHKATPCTCSPDISSPSEP